MSSEKPIPSGSRSAVRSGLVTSVAALLVSISAAGAGALLTQKFGRNALTDGFLAAYGVYLVLVLAAQAFRLVVVPDLTHAEREGRLGGEFRAYAWSFVLMAVPICVVVGLLRHEIGSAITGSLPPTASHIASQALVWLVPAAFGQLLAALAASALAARDSYVAAAVGYGGGAIASLAVFAAFADSKGLLALAWGLALNAAIAVGVPTFRLWQLGALRGGPKVEARILHRLGRLAQGGVLPIVIQGLYVVAIRFASDLGVGQDTTLSYAYLLSATFVTITAAPLALISSAPLTRLGLDADGAARHVVSATWVSGSVVAAAAGVFALVGGTLAETVLGSAFAGQVGHELGRLIVWFSPWMLAAVGFSLTFPLVFVMGRTRPLIPLAIVMLPVDVGLSWILRRAFGLGGIVLALAISTAIVFAVLLFELSPRVLGLTARGVLRVALVEGGAAVLCFGIGFVVLGRWGGALAGLAAYALLLYLGRRLGLEAAVAYVRGLHAHEAETGAG